MTPHQITLAAICWPGSGRPEPAPPCSHTRYVRLPQWISRPWRWLKGTDAYDEM